MQSINTAILITGANRGLGRGLLEVYLGRSKTTVIAAVRDPDDATAKSLFEIERGNGSQLIVVRIDSKSETDPAEAMDYLRRKHNLTTLDVVIANAGIGKTYPDPKASNVANISIADMYEHYTINTVATVLLFQAVLPFLESSSRNPRFVAMSSGAGSIGGMELLPFPNAAYGPSKVALNYLTRKMHFEHENLIVFPIDPGWVQTRMGNAGALTFGFKQASVTIQESVAGMITVIDNATLYHTSGEFQRYNGKGAPW